MPPLSRICNTPHERCRLLVCSAIILFMISLWTITLTTAHNNIIVSITLPVTLFVFVMFAIYKEYWWRRSLPPVSVNTAAHTLQVLDFAGLQAMLDKECLVCLSPYEIGQSLRVLDCKHSFHDNCISAWPGGCPMRCAEPAPAPVHVV